MQPESNLRPHAKLPKGEAKGKIVSIRFGFSNAEAERLAKLHGGTTQRYPIGFVTLC